MLVEERPEAKALMKVKKMSKKLLNAKFEQEWASLAEELGAELSYEQYLQVMAHMRFSRKP